MIAKLYFATPDIAERMDIHRPPHVYLDDMRYFITAGTFRKKCLWNTKAKIQWLSSLLCEISGRYNINLYAWIILPNHYHLLLKTSRGEELVKFFRKLHSDSASYLNRLEDAHSRRVWYQYWDRCIRDDRDFWVRFNYIHQNAVKHGWAEKMEDYEFSTYKEYLEKNGTEWMMNCFEQYPIIDFTTGEDNF